MFFTYNQNNSGGSFVYDEKAGITHYVIVEALSHEEANEKAKEIGLYFDGSGDCACCGNRWHEAWLADGDEAPKVYGCPAESDEVTKPTKWMKGYEVFIHYADGRIIGLHGEVR